jgi:hypothetical protein
MARSLAVFALAFAGVFLLAGAGWALLTGAALVVVLWRREPDWRTLAARVVTVVRSAPRRVAAVAGMTGGVTLVPVGLGVAAGAGAGLVAAGAALAGVSLLAGWNA